MDTRTDGRREPEGQTGVEIEIVILDSEEKQVSGAVLIGGQGGHLPTQFSENLQIFGEKVHKITKIKLLLSQN